MHSHGVCSGGYQSVFPVCTAPYSLNCVPFAACGIVTLRVSVKMYNWRGKFSIPGPMAFAICGDGKR